MEKWGPCLAHMASYLETPTSRPLASAEMIDQPVFNLFYPCGLPFWELDDYP